MTTLTSEAAAILNTADPAAKCAMTQRLAAAWRRGDLDIGTASPPDRPARPARPQLCRPGDMPKRSTGPKGRIALIHALAHIELNAVDLAWDIIARFTSDDLPRAFFDEWVQVAEEEAQHYAALAARLGDWDTAYGDLPAHDSLWESAIVTADDLAARLVIIPMTLEARGLDTTPPTSARLRENGDEATAAILDMIYFDEIKHLAVGVRWFTYICARDGRDPHATYAAILAERFTGTLKPPFNLAARTSAGMGEDYLQPWLGKSA